MKLNDIFGTNLPRPTILVHLPIFILCHSDTHLRNYKKSTLTKVNQKHHYVLFVYNEYSSCLEAKYDYKNYSPSQLVICP